MTFFGRLFILLGVLCSGINAQSTTTTAGGATTTTTAGGATTTTTSGGATTTTIPGCADNSTSCASWAKNGFCTSTFYTTAQKQQSCMSTCGLCSGGGGGSGNGTCSGCTDNSSCAEWVSNGFCSNSRYTIAQKRQYCPNRCCLCTSG